MDDFRFLPWTPLQSDAAPTNCQHVSRRLFAILRERLELTTSVETDVVPRHRPDVQDVTDGSLLDMRPLLGPLALGQNLNLLRPNRVPAPVSLDHGGPARVIIPKLYAWKGSKFVSGITFLAEDKLGFWEVRGYSNGADPWTEDRYA